MRTRYRSRRGRSSEWAGSGLIGCSWPRFASDCLGAVHLQPRHGLYWVAKMRFCVQGMDLAHPGDDPVGDCHVAANAESSI